MIIQFPVEVRSIKSTVDRSILVQLCTQEMSNDDCAVLFALRETLAWCVLASQEIKPEEVKPEIVGRKEGKTASQRRRDKMAVYYYKMASAAVVYYMFLVKSEH